MFSFSAFYRQKSYQNWYSLIRAWLFRQKFYTFSYHCQSLSFYLRYFTSFTRPFLLRLVITSSFQLPSSTKHTKRGLRFAPTNMQQCNLPFIHLVFSDVLSSCLKFMWKPRYDGFVVANASTEFSSTILIGR